MSFKLSKGEVFCQTLLNIRANKIVTKIIESKLSVFFDFWKKDIRLVGFFSIFFKFKWSNRSYKLLKSEFPRITKSFYSTFLNQDNQVIENYQDLGFLKTKRFTGKDVWYDENQNEHVAIGGTNVYINGFMINKQDEIKDFVFRRT